jgi:hypothetical protein
MNYIDQLASRIGDRCDMSMEDEKERRLLRQYAVIAYATGGNVTARQVHDAWSAWQAETQPDHPSLVPFELLSEEVQCLDDLFVHAIREASWTSEGNMIEETGKLVEVRRSRDGWRADAKREADNAAYWRGRAGRLEKLVEEAVDQDCPYLECPGCRWLRNVLIEEVREPEEEIMKNQRELGRLDVCVGEALAALLDPSLGDQEARVKARDWLLHPKRLRG